MQRTLLGLLVLVSSLPFQDDPTLEERFAAEPVRPKAEVPVQFTRSWDRARAESNRAGRRILAVFTGENCGWCRILERRTFTDAEVVQLSKQFVCVELYTGKEVNVRLTDEYRIDSIPRSFVLTADGHVVSKRTGYMPPAEYAAWLREALVKSPAPRKTEGPAAAAPPPVGALEPEADVLIWYVDGSRSIARWGDDDWTGHRHLINLLHATGLRPRVEHMAREGFPQRWDRAAAADRVPELIVAQGLAGLVRDLESKGRLVHVESDRLAWAPENASCPDFVGRMAFLVSGARHEAAGRRAVVEILRPGPETTVPGPMLTDANGRAEAIAVARRAAVAYVSGDPVGLKSVASQSSPQLTRCSKPDGFRRGWEVSAGSVDVRGGAAIAFASVETQFRAQKLIGADPVLVVLDREATGWKAFAVSRDIVSIRELPAFCRLDVRAGSVAGNPLVPRLLAPSDGGRIDLRSRSFTWEIPAEGAPLAAEVCQVLLNDKDSSWPETRLKVYPGAPRLRSLLATETAENLTGMTAYQMSWCVWSIALDGRIAVSAVRSYRSPEFKTE
jgi:hypothetical protein